jgi:hypothetical protein
MDCERGRKWLLESDGMMLNERNSMLNYREWIIKNLSKMDVVFRLCFHFCDWSSIVFFSLQTITSQIKYYHSVDRTPFVPTPQKSTRSNGGRTGIISGRPITRRTVRSTRCMRTVSCSLPCQPYRIFDLRFDPRFT